MHRAYKWKFELEFNSLSDFRDVVCDWSALKGLPVNWVKNESTSVRVECERKYGFYIGLIGLYPPCNVSEFCNTPYKKISRRFPLAM
jgi:hypothetical protein